MGTDLEIAKKELETAQKKFVDTEKTLHVAHDAFISSCDELEIAERKVQALTPLTANASVH